jgi:hypothetical protein
MLQLVLTGGPCGGKTTGQARLATFFENLGWKGRLSNSLSSSGLYRKIKLDQVLRNRIRILSFRSLRIRILA